RHDHHAAPVRRVVEVQARPAVPLETARAAVPLEHHADRHQHQPEDEERRQHQEEHDPHVGVGVQPEGVEQVDEDEDDGAERGQGRAREGQRMSGHSDVIKAKAISATRTSPAATAAEPITRPTIQARPEGGPASGASPASLADSAGGSSRDPCSGARRVKITMPIGTSSGRRWLLKKWIVKMNPTASSASSPCTSSAMLTSHPVMPRANATGNQSSRPEPPMIAMPQKTAQ